ncbi:MAG: TlpA family protein disulfide reductase [Candidatus Hodarchaeales archaeon]|jgi:hypothetical protein
MIAPKKISVVLFFVLFSISLLNINTVNASSTLVSNKVQKSIDPNFIFTLENGTVVSISDYPDKTFIIEWGASWCPVCGNNIEVVNTFVNTWKPWINFLSISYGGSGDTLDDLNKGSYDQKHKMDTGLDHTNYASTIGAGNGDIQFIYSDFTVREHYKYKYLAIDIIREEFKWDLVDLIREDATFDPEESLPGSEYWTTSTSSNSIPETTGNNSGLSSTSNENTSLATTPSFNIFTLSFLLIPITIISLHKKRKDR